MLVVITCLFHTRHHGTMYQEACYLSQKDDSFAVRPNHMVHLGAHSFPGQLRGP